jgi:Fe-S oxidoreductase
MGHSSPSRNAMSAAPSRVALFITCFNDTLFPETGRAVVSLLERLGVPVDFPLEHTCCGQMPVNTGYAAQTIPLVRRFVRDQPRDQRRRRDAPRLSIGRRRLRR